MNILLAADGSLHTKAAAQHLARHIHWFAGKPAIHVLHVRPGPAFPPGWAVGEDAWMRDQRVESEAALELARCELSDAGLACVASWRIGEPHEEIARYVREQDIDLVVMGSHGRGDLANLALGSVTTKCIATLEVPILVVRYPPAA